MLARLRHPLPFATDEKWHQKVKAFISVRGKCQRRQARCLCRHTQLFFEFADQRRLGTFSGLDLATRKLPQSRELLSRRPLRDEDTTIYLLGTFHLLDGRTWFNDEVKAAFDASSELILEVLLPEDPAQQQAIMGPLVMQYAVDPQGRTLSSRLTAEENEAMNRQLAGLGVPAGAFDRFEPWFVSLTLVQIAAQRLNLDAANAPEIVLRRAARERGMTEGQLETSDFQIRMLDSVPEESQLRGLKEMIADPEAGVRTLRPMLDAWSRGDERAIAAITMQDSGNSDPVFYDILFTNRNATWAEWIEDRLERPGTVFVAVGAGHLVGRGSVQEHLTRAGIASARVPRAATVRVYPWCRSRSEDRCRQR